MRRNRQQAPRAFTIIELLVSIAVIAILIGLLVVGLRYAVAAARSAAATQSVSGLRVAVQSFKNDFGFLPPLVRDGYPSTPDTQGPLVPAGTRIVPNVYSFAADQQFLRGEQFEPDYRFSVCSLPYYIIGALPKEVDGREGPGALAPRRDGQFDSLSNRSFEPYFAVKSDRLAYGGWTAGESQAIGRWELRDANGVAYRYYRWSPGDSADPNRKGVLNVPELVEAGASLTELGQAEFAIVAAGADGVFGDLHDDPPPPVHETVEMIEDALGQRFGGTPEDLTRAEAAAREDNVVEVGR